MNQIKKIAGFIHLWLGLTSGIVVFVVSLTGAMYVFSEDIMEWSEWNSRRVNIENSPALLPSQIMAAGHIAIDSLYGKQPQKYWDWQTITYLSSPDRAVALSGHRYENPESYYAIYVNPYSGKVTSAKDIAGTNFWRIILDLHLTLMLGEFGSFLVRYGTLVFLVMLISGIILWWPKNRNAAKQRFWFKWKTALKWKRKNYDLHNILGFYASWIVVFMAITGAMWSFEWFNDAIVFSLNAGQTNAAADVPKIYNFESNRRDLKVIDKIIERTISIEPNAFGYNLFFSANGSPHEMQVMSSISNSGADTYYFNPNDGNLLSQNLFRDKPTGQQFSDISGDIHYGWIWGWPSKIITFIACLIVASLPITGFMVWWGRKNKSTTKTPIVRIVKTA